MRGLRLVGALVVVAALVVGCRPTPEHREFIRDDLGRALILHGANVSGAAKYPPTFLPPHTEADFARMADAWGMNLVRYLISWEAVEPEQGVYDEAYLDAVVERIRWAEAHGLHVVVDMHQDVWGPHWTENAPVGNGAPAWATRTDGLAPIPALYRGPWWLQSIQPPVARAFDNFWAGDAGPHPDLQQHYRAAWRHVVERVHTEPAVLGYDLMNEPFSGSRAAGFESGPLARMYESVIAEIRQVDQDGWIFLEPQSFLVNQGVPSQLPRIEDPRDGEPRIAYFPHLYTVETELGGGYAGNNVFIDYWAANRVRESERLGAPLLSGEFGLAASTVGFAAYIDEVLEMFDQVTSGWAYWSYEIGDGSWGLIDPAGQETPHVDHLVRAYPRAVAGDPITYAYDPATDVFRLRWRETGVDAPTEIFVPDRHYPAGWEVTGTDPDGAWSWTWDADRQLLSVTADPAQAEHEIVVRPAA